MKTKLIQDDFEYVMVWVRDDETTQLPSPPPMPIKKKGLALRILATILSFSLKKSLGLILLFSYYLLILEIIEKRKAICCRKCIGSQIMLYEFCSISRYVRLGKYLPTTNGFFLR